MRATCAFCGNEYDKAFKLEHEGKTYFFDCFECAISMLAPRCATCNGRILGHGLEADGSFYCSAHCARKMGVSAQDRLDARA
jgi:hypothetical protein